MKLGQPLTKAQTEKFYKLSGLLVAFAFLSNAILFASIEVQKAEKAFNSSQKVLVKKQ